MVLIGPEHSSDSTQCQKSNLRSQVCRVFILLDKPPLLPHRNQIQLLPTAPYLKALYFETELPSISQSSHKDPQHT